MKRDLPLPPLDTCMAAMSATRMHDRPGRVARERKPLPALSEAQHEAMRQDWHDFEAQLFARIAEEQPALLAGPWELLLGLVQQQPRYWVHPTVSLAQMESEPGLVVEPFIDVDALAHDWPAPKQRVWLAC